MKDLLAWFGLKHFPFDKNIKTQDVFHTDSLKECSARLDYIKRRGGILLLTGDPGSGQNPRPADTSWTASMKISSSPSTPPFPPSAAQICSTTSIASSACTPRLSKSAIYTQVQRAFLESKETSGKTILLMIDEAHLLQTGPLEELRLADQLQNGLL